MTIKEEMDRKTKTKIRSVHNISFHDLLSLHLDFDSRNLITQEKAKLLRLNCKSD